MEVTANDMEAGQRDAFLFVPSTGKGHFDEERTMKRRTFLGGERCFVVCSHEASRHY